MRRFAMSVLVAGIALTALIWLWRGGPHESTVITTNDDAGAQRMAPVPSPANGEVEATATDSLRGTEVDGAITLDASGQPIADRGMRRLFDYFLARIGEQSLPAIRAALSAHLSTQFAAPVVTAVLDRYDAYVALTQEMAALSPTGDDLEDAARLRALRRARLGEAIAEAWYGDEERYLQATLARRAIVEDTSLDDAKKAQALAALDDSLDPAQRAGRQQTDAMNDAIAQTARFDAAGTSDAERFAEREKTVGREAAARLAALDREHAAWNARLADFSAQRQRLLGDPRLSDSARAQAIQNLLVSRFDARERLRVDALDRGGLLPDTSGQRSTPP